MKVITVLRKSASVTAKSATMTAKKWDGLRYEIGY